jgi:hypothetical protein
VSGPSPALAGPAATDPAAALEALASTLRGQGTLISACVREPAEPAALGILVAAGPRAAPAPGAYAQVIEAVREGYLLHYGQPRLVVTDDRDLALLAGDYMYANGLALLASLGDLEAVRELAELIALCAHAHTAKGGDVPALWLAATVAIGVGEAPEHRGARDAFRAGEPAGERLWLWASSTAAEAGLGEQLEAAVKTVGFDPNGRG